LVYRQEIFALPCPSGTSNKKLAKPGEPPESDDGDSGHDGNPDRHHFSRGTAPRIQGFRCARGVIDGESTGAAGGSGTSRAGYDRRHSGDHNADEHAGLIVLALWMGLPAKSKSKSGSSLDWAQNSCRSASTVPL